MATEFAFIESTLKRRDADLLLYHVSDSKIYDSCYCAAAVMYLRIYNAIALYIHTGAVVCVISLSRSIDYQHVRLSPLTWRRQTPLLHFCVLRGRHVIPGVCLSVYLVLCLLATLRKNYWTDIHNNLITGVSIWTMKKLVKFLAIICLRIRIQEFFEVFFNTAR